MKLIHRSDALFDLIKSLTKSEKRLFTIFMGRFEYNKDAEFLALFKTIEKMKVYDESVIIKKHKYTKTQLLNFKSHLYRQILLTLRLNPKNLNLKQTIYDQFMTATILHEKGLSEQGLKFLKRIKEMAKDNGEQFIYSETLELEKTIVSQNLRQGSRAIFKELISESQDLPRKEMLQVKLSNFSLQLYSAFIQFGAVKNKSEYIKLKNFFEENMPDVNTNNLGFYGELHYYQCHFWYAMGTQDFVSSYKYANHWVNLFYKYKAQISHNYTFFLKAHYYMFESLLFSRSHKKLREAIDNLEAFIFEHDIVFSKNSEYLLSYYLWIGKINLYFLKGTFKEGVVMVNQILTKLLDYDQVLGKHKMTVLYYKIACLYFGAGDNRKCIEYLAKVLVHKDGSQDLLCFSKFLNLIAHYEEGLDYHLEFLIKDTYKYLLKLNELNLIQKRIISFFRGLREIYPVDLKKSFSKLLEDLKEYSNNPFERRTFLYLDIISWLEGKIHNVPIDQIIKDKAVS